jgi:hypothetical protein
VTFKFNVEPKIYKIWIYALNMINLVKYYKICNFLYSTVFVNVDLIEYFGQFEHNKKKLNSTC